MALIFTTRIARITPLVTKMRSPLTFMVKHASQTDAARRAIGKREIVGYGWNGSPVYCDRIDFPFPAVRFREADAEICLLREKEKGDWKKLTIADKKKLYRYSFCQTFAEMKAPSGDLRMALATGIMATAFAILSTFLYLTHLNKQLGVPPSFDDEHQRAQLKRMLIMEVDPIDGLASKWDYENDRWK